MPHALTELKLNSVTKPADERPHEIRADVCVVGAGIAGLSAAIESARLGRDPGARISTTRAGFCGAMRRSQG